MKILLLLIFLSISCPIFGQIDSLKTVIQSQQEKAEAFLNLALAYSKEDKDSAAISQLTLAIAQAQLEDNQDILMEAIIEKAYQFMRMDFADSSEYYFQQMLQGASNPTLSPKTRLKAYYQSGVYYSRQDEFFSALRSLDTAYAYAIEYQDSTYQADVLNKIGAVNNNMGRYSIALDNFLKCMEIYHQIGDEEYYIQTMNNVAVIYKKVNDFDNAMKYYNKSIDFNQDRKDPVGLAVPLVNRGLLKKDLEKYREALEDLFTALKIFEDEDYTYGIAVVRHNLGETYLAKNNLDSALYFLEKSQDSALPFKFNRLIVKNQLAIAKLYQKVEQYSISNNFATSGYQMAKENGQLEDLRDLCFLMSENYEANKQFGSSLNYFKEYEAVKDSILNRESAEELNLLRTEYEVMQKDNEIEYLASEASLQTSLAKEQRKLNIALSIGFLVLIAFFAVLFMLYRNQKQLSERLKDQKSTLLEQKEEIEAAQEQILKQNEDLRKLNKEKDGIIATVAHDLRSPLNQIRALLGFVKMEKNQEAIDQYIDLATQSADILRERINRILDIEAINAGNINLQIAKVEVDGVLKYLEQHTYESARKKHMQLHVNSQQGLHCEADENYLLQILENLCTNAIKFSPRKSEITVSATSENDGILFAVKDQGPGIPEHEKDKLFVQYAKISNKPTGDEKSTGLGLSIVKKYVEAMNGEVWCESEVNRGSCFYVKIPKATAA